VTVRVVPRTQRRKPMSYSHLAVELVTLATAPRDPNLLEPA
jgi:hypothetical protein